MIPVLVQCRLGSQRLPCKVIYPVKGKPLIRYMYERLLNCINASHVMFVCPLKDAPVIAGAGVPVYGVEGDEQDVWSRYMGVLNNHKEIRQARQFVRLCADSPLIDAGIVDKLICAAEGFTNSTAALVSNTQPRTWPDGQCVEVIDIGLMRSPLKWRGVNPTIHDREHIGPWFYREMPEYCHNIVNMEGDHSGRPLTVDTMEDFKRVAGIIERMTRDHTEYGWRECLELMS